MIAFMGSATTEEILATDLLVNSFPVLKSASYVQVSLSNLLKC